MIVLALLAAQPELPELPIPLEIHGWEEVGSQPAVNDASITMRYWVANASIKEVNGQPDQRFVTVTIEIIAEDGTQAELRTLGQVIDCKGRTWQNEWGAFSVYGKAFVSYFTDAQKAEPQVPKAASGMEAVVDRVCLSDKRPKS